jgi:hypothetical protein
MEQPYRVSPAREIERGIDLPEGFIVIRQMSATVLGPLTATILRIPGARQVKFYPVHKEQRAISAVIN